jgi:hypothetical protein
MLEGSLASPVTKTGFWTSKQQKSARQMGVRGKQLDVLAHCRTPLAHRTQAPAGGAPRGGIRRVALKPKRAWRLQRAAAASNFDEVKRSFSSATSRPIAHLGATDLDRPNPDLECENHEIKLRLVNARIRSASSVSGQGTGASSHTTRPPTFATAATSSTKEAPAIGA